MSLAFPKLARGLLLAGLLSGAWSPAEAQQPARRRTPKVDFTEPGSTTNSRPTETTNLSEVTPRLPGLGGLDQTIRKPYDFFNAENSFGGVSAPPAGMGRSSPQNSKQARERRDQKKNWVFTTPEDVYGLPSPEQRLHVPEYDANGEVKKSKTSLERYLDRLENYQSNNATNHGKGDRPPDWLKPDDTEDRYIGREDKAGERSIFGSGRANSKRDAAESDLAGPLSSSWSSPTEKSYNEFFSLGSSDTSSKPAVPDAAAAERMQIFKQLLPAQSSPGLGAALGVSTPNSSIAPPLASPFSAGVFGRDSLSPQPAPNSYSLPSVAPATTLPNNYGSSYGSTYAPSASGSRQLTPPSSVFAVPQRKY